MEFEKKEFDIKNSSQEEIENLYGLSSVNILKNKVMFYEECGRADILKIELMLNVLIDCYYALFASLVNPESIIDHKEVISIINTQTKALINCYETTKSKYNQQKN
jgi:hypothetical protein